MIGNRPLVFACGWGRTIWGIKWFSGKTGEKLLQETWGGGGGGNWSSLKEYKGGTVKN